MKTLDKKKYEYYLTFYLSILRYDPLVTYKKRRRKKTLFGIPYLFLQEMLAISPLIFEVMS